MTLINTHLQFNKTPPLNERVKPHSQILTVTWAPKGFYQWIPWEKTIPKKKDFNQWVRTSLLQ